MLRLVLIFVVPQINVTHAALDVVLRALRDWRDWRDHNSAIDRPREEVGGSPRRETSLAWIAPPTGDGLVKASAQRR